MSLLKKLVDTEYKELKRFNKIADEIEALDETYSKMSDEELKGKTAEFRERLAKGETLEDIKVEAFATAREAAYRMIGEKPYRVQLIGGLAIHYGNIAEMKTGEGKTLTTILPAYLNALPGKGVHVVTVNEYLSDRNAKWMGPIYDFLGITVGVNLRELTPSQKRDVYNCDITYSTNNEIGFDYLRDNMVTKKEDRTQRGLNYCIIDEVDSILIDEARTPLIISGGKMNSANLYMDADRAVKRLIAEEDYIIDEKAKSVILTEKGSIKVQTYFKLANLYDAENTALVHHINQALKANFGMKKDVDYVVDDEGNVVIVDQFTGRLMHGRQFSEGLHQAIEAKEGVKINEETKTLATITFQNLFRMYNKISGMTGTAKTEEEEFRDIYNMYVICIPTNKPVERIDASDLVFATKNAKYKAIINEVKERYTKGQPVLIGTIAIETSELISALLKKEKIPHEILNAKNHAREAEIISKIGQHKSVTIATNMAGRGTDIKLSDEIRALGGLCVIGTERHESRRIDNQLRGRSGRQGDPGFTQFFVSMEDDLMVRFGSEKIKEMMTSFGFGDQAIQNKYFSKAITTAQKRVEGNNFDARKQLLQYDDVMNTQREIMYGRRNEILDSESVHEQVLECMRNYVTDLVKSHTIDGILSEQDKKEIVSFANENLLDKDITENDISSLLDDDMIDFLYNKAKEEYEEKLSDVPVEITSEFEKALSLQVIDNYWMEQINVMSHLREGIYLRSYGQEDPLRAYSTEGFDLFDQMLQKIDHDVTIFLLKAEIQKTVERKPVTRNVQTNDDKSDSVKKPKKSKKVGRNDPCPCGSGKKYKQCCGK